MVILGSSATTSPLPVHLEDIANPSQHFPAELRCLLLNKTTGSLSSSDLASKKKSMCLPSVSSLISLSLYTNLPTSQSRYSDSRAPKSTGCWALLLSRERPLWHIQLTFNKTTCLEWLMSSPRPAQPCEPDFLNNPKVILAFPLQVLISFFNQGKSIQLLKSISRKILLSLAIPFPTPSL